MGPLASSFPDYTGLALILGAAGLATLPGLALAVLNLREPRWWSRVLAILLGALSGCAGGLCVWLFPSADAVALALFWGLIAAGVAQVLSGVIGSRLTGARHKNPPA